MYYILCVCVLVALDIHHAMRKRHTVVCGLSASNHILSTLSTKHHDFREKATKHKMCSDFLCNFCLKHFSF